MNNIKSLSKSRLRAFNFIKTYVTNPIYIISLVAIVLLSYTILVPLWKILQGTFMFGVEDSGPDVVPGEFTLSHWASALFSDVSRPLVYEPLLNSLGIGIVVSVLALALGSGIAWLVVRTDIPYKKTIGFLLILPYMFPSWFKAFVWLIVFKNDRVGGQGGLFQYIFNIAPPDWLAYGFLPIVLALTTHYYVFAYLLVGAALGSMGSSLEESAGILGASKGTTLRRITFPLVLPAILSAFILIISKAIGAFGVPAFLGLPVRYYTLSTMIYSSINGGRTTVGFILALILIVIASLIVWYNQRLISKRNYETIGGKDSANKLTSLGRWRVPAITAIWTFIGIVSIIPVVLMVWQTLMLRDGDYSFSNLTLHYWIGDSDPNIANGTVGLFKNSNIISGLKNSLTISVTASIAAALIGIMLGYIITRAKKMATSKIIDQLSFLPYLIPGIALSAIYLSMFSKPTLFIPAIYGTLSLLILITVVKDLPFATRAGTSTMIQIGGELEEAGRITGASWFTRFRKIMLPLSKKGILSAFIIAFISAMKELDLIIILVTPSTSTLTTLTFDYAEQGYSQLADSVVTLIIFIIAVVYILTTTLGKTDISKGIGGQ